MLRPVRLAAPAVSVIDLVDAKSHMHVDYNDDDELIEAFIAAAIAHLDGYSGILGRCLVHQTWQQNSGEWPSGSLRLPFPDVSGVTVTYFDQDNAQQTLPASQYRLLEDARGAFLEWDDSFKYPSLFERGDAISVSMECGYGANKADVPASIRIAVQMLVAHFYQNREAAGAGLSETPFGVLALVSPYRRIGL